MRRTIIALTMLIQACSATVDSEAPVAMSPQADRIEPQSGSEKKRAGLLPVVRNEACVVALTAAKKVEDKRTLSVFRLFNEYPPSHAKKDPGTVDTTSVPTHSPELMSCLENLPFTFDVLVDGLLVKGSRSRLSPLTAWEVPGGHLAFYLHKNYVMDDGEGESVEISAIALDGVGKPVGSIQGLSSWYEYEGSVRIRDFVQSNGEFTTIEEVFDPVEQDEAVNVLDYAGSGERSIFKRYSLEF